MSKAIVIGAGWAGLSAAVELAGKGFEVTLLEQSKRLGGRASSFRDEKTGEVVDNGQHLFMGCYQHTINFLKKVGSIGKLKFQKNLSVSFVDLKGKISTLNCLSLPAPLHLFSGLLSLGTLSLKEKLAMMKVYRAIKDWNGNGSLENVTVQDWLIQLGQSERSRKYFWDLITIATLNEQSSIAAADALAIVLKEAFFADKEKSQIAISGVGLSELCGAPAEKFLREHHGTVLNNQLTTKIEIEDDQVKRLVMRDGFSLTADVYVSAVPFFILRNLLNEKQRQSDFFSKLEHLKSSPIFSISLWFDREVTDCEFVGMLDTEVQWLFNKSKIFGRSYGGYVSLVISGAHKHLTMTNDELLKICLNELHQCFPQSRSAQLKHWLIQREKNATLSPQIGYSRYRPTQKTPLKNFFLCGDWTDTGFPATIESAVYSGVKAAEAVG